MRIEKTVFIAYRRTNVYHALAVYKELTARGYDVFMDYASIDSGAFDQIILRQIDARAHFLVLLTLSALERCADPDDWLRREIERALDMQRNVVPLMFDGFNYASMQKYLTGKLAALAQYNGLTVPAEYFDEAMGRLIARFLNTPLDAVIHPTPPEDHVGVQQRQAEAESAPKPTEEQLSAEQYVERGNKRYDQNDHDGEIADYTEAIRLNPQYAIAYYNRGVARQEQGDTAGAIADYTEAVRLDPQDAAAYSNRGSARYDQGDYMEAITDCNEAIRLDPEDAIAHNNRGEAYFALKQYGQALEDFKKADDLKPGYNSALGGLAITYHAMGNVQEARTLWRVLIRMDAQYRDAEWVKTKLNWADPLVEEARKLIAGL
jgi:tetratricopeptide (TPR) repeat protein